QEPTCSPFANSPLAKAERSRLGGTPQLIAQLAVIDGARQNHAAHTKRSDGECICAPRFCISVRSLLERLNHQFKRSLECLSDRPIGARNVVGQADHREVSAVESCSASDK